MFLTKNIVLSEVVPANVYNQWGNAAMWFIDIRIVRVAQYISDNINPEKHEAVTINGMFDNEMFNESGFREFDTTTGASKSQHKFGRALDIKFHNYTPDRIRQFIKDNWAVLKEIGLTTIEKDTPAWIHIDCRYTGLETLYEVPYK